MISIAKYKKKKYRESHNSLRVKNQYLFWNVPFSYTYSATASHHIYCYYYCLYDLTFDSMIHPHTMTGKQQILYFLVVIALNIRGQVQRFRGSTKLVSFLFLLLQVIRPLDIYVVGLKGWKVFGIMLLQRLATIRYLVYVYTYHYNGKRYWTFARDFYWGNTEVQLPNKQ